MSVYGIRGCALEWLRSCLLIREQYILINHINSGLGTEPPGLGTEPPGLGTWSALVFIFINDFPNSSDIFRFTLYAADSTPTCSFKNKT